MLDERGREVLDSTPVAIPVGFKRPESLAETIRRLVRSQVSSYASEHGLESFEEANDFDVDGDVPIKTPYEEDVDNVEGIGDVDGSSVGAGLDAVRAGLAEAPPPVKWRPKASEANPAKPAGDGSDKGGSPDSPPADGGKPGSPSSKGVAG